MSAFSWKYIQLKKKDNTNKTFQKYIYQIISKYLIKPMLYLVRLYTLEWMLPNAKKNTIKTIYN